MNWSLLFEIISHTFLYIIKYLSIALKVKLLCFQLWTNIELLNKSIVCNSFLKTLALFYIIICNSSSFFKRLRENMVNKICGKISLHRRSYYKQKWKNLHMECNNISKFMREMWQCEECFWHMNSTRYVLFYIESTMHLLIFMEGRVTHPEKGIQNLPWS